MEITIRKGEKRDLQGVMQLVQELAEFENASHEVQNTKERMEAEGFGENPAFEFFVAEYDNQIIGIALYFFSYSTWKGRSCFLDDLIVTEAFRGKGVGKKLFNKVAEVAKNQNCGKMHWQVLDWNAPAIAYYKSLNAKFDAAWVNCWLDNEALQNY
ncbi:MAG: GNAT family N-acetyltransferase [Cyclobacteriaceae bacterium]|nr:GNAT family N-acetyltransferase [Cyclobacteriaceae bacterium]